MKSRISLGIPYLCQDEISAVNRVIKSGYLSLGQETEKFEQGLARYCQTKYAVAVSSGTAALHVSVIASNIKSGDEVITSPFSFVATTNCLLYEKVRPVYVDINPETLNLDVNKIEPAITKKTKAILGVDIFGYPAEWQEIRRIAAKYNLQVIEDAAEAFGAQYQGKVVGNLGHLTTFGFFPNKQMTTGEGGAVLTNDRSKYLKLKRLINQGKLAGSLENNYFYLGYNYRMTEISAALGTSQLKKIDFFLKKRFQAAALYQSILKKINGIKFLKSDDPQHQRSWFVFPILLDKKINRAKVIKQLTSQKIATKTYFSPLHLEPYLQYLGYKKGDFPVCESISPSILCLPFYTDILPETIHYVSHHLAKAINVCAA